MAEKSDSIVVIGTGPSAAAFCERMQQIGRRVTVISEGGVVLPTYTDRISQIDSSAEIWKFTDVQANLKIEFIKHNNFDHIAIRGLGGLSSRWGAGVAKLNSLDLGINTKIASHIHSYYDCVQAVVGVVDNLQDPMASYLGEFDNSDIKIGNQSKTLSRLTYSTDKVVFGKSAQAVLQFSKPEANRLPCNFCGHCSIFCGRNSLYNAAHSFANLSNFHNIIELTRVDDIKKTGTGFEIFAVQSGKETIIEADIVILAAGPVNTYKILKKTILSELKRPISLLNTPILRGMAFSPIAQKNKRQIVGSTVARIKINETENALVTFVDGQSIPVSDWLSFLPVRNRFVAWVIKRIRKYFMAYMVFFNSDYSNNALNVENDQIKIDGGHSVQFSSATLKAVKYLKAFLNKNRFFELAILRKIMPPGRDIHCGGTLPMKSNSENVATTTTDCELRGQPNLFVIDGSWMPRICEKSHTFTLMANAMRVADIVNAKIKKLP